MSLMTPLLTIPTLSTEGTQKQSDSPRHSVAEPPALPPSWRGAGSGVGRCGRRAIHRVEGWDPGQRASPGWACTWRVLLPRSWGGVPEVWAAPGWEDMHPVEGCFQGIGARGQRAGSEGWGRVAGGTICFPRVGGPGQRTGAGTSHRVLQQGAGGGRAPPCSRGAGRGRAGVTRVRGHRGAGGTPGSPLSLPREDPRRAPLPAAPSRAPVAGQ